MTRLLTFLSAPAPIHSDRNATSRLVRESRSTKNILSFETTLGLPPLKENLENQDEKGDATASFHASIVYYCVFWHILSHQKEKFDWLLELTHSPASKTCILNKPHTHTLLLMWKWLNWDNLIIWAIEYDAKNKTEKALNKGEKRI